MIKGEVYICINEELDTFINRKTENLKRYVIILALENDSYCYVSEDGECEVVIKCRKDNLVSVTDYRKLRISSL